MVHTHLTHEGEKIERYQDLYFNLAEFKTGKPKNKL